MLNLADGRVSLFYIGEPILFGVAKTIAREHLSIKRCDTLVMDLSDVPYLDETAALVIEAAIKDSQAKGSQVFIVGAVGKVKHLLESLGILNLVPYDNLFLDRTDALKQAVVVDVAEIGLRTG